VQIIGELNGKKGEALMLAGGLALRPSELAVFAEVYEVDQFSLGTLILNYDLYSTDAFTQFQAAYHLIEQWLYSDGEGHHACRLCKFAVRSNSVVERSCLDS
jgi:hypothetical protein